MRKPKYIRNSKKIWNEDAVKLFRRLVKGNTPTRVIGLKLGRSAKAIYDKAKKLHLSLMPPNRSPYNRRKRNNRR